MFISVSHRSSAGGAVQGPLDVPGPRRKEPKHLLPRRLHHSRLLLPAPPRGPGRLLEFPQCYIRFPASGRAALGGQGEEAGKVPASSSEGVGWKVTHICPFSSYWQSCRHVATTRALRYRAAVLLPAKKMCPAKNWGLII